MQSQLLLWGRVTPMVALAVPHVLFVIVRNACHGLLVRRLGPCLWAAGISCHAFWLQSQVTLMLSTFNMSSCLWKLQPARMVACASCLLVKSNMMTLICRAPGGSDPTLIAVSLLPNSCNSCRSPTDCTGYSLAMLPFVPKALQFCNWGL